MAYVMNPNSFKLGYSKSWTNNWYANNKLYPLILNVMLNVRSFLLYFLTDRNLEKIDIYLSHINIGINSGKLFVSLFFYDTNIDFKNMRWFLKRWEGTLSLRKYNLFKHKRKHTSYWPLKKIKLTHRWSAEVLNILSTKGKVYEAQRFFLLFNSLGLDPENLLLQFYKRLPQLHTKKMHMLLKGRKKLQRIYKLTKINKKKAPILQEIQRKKRRAYVNKLKKQLFKKGYKNKFRKKLRSLLLKLKVKKSKNLLKHYKKERDRIIQAIGFQHNTRTKNRAWMKPIEMSFLSWFFSNINKDPKFTWYRKEDMNKLLLFRNLFFYQGMPFFGRSYDNLLKNYKIKKKNIYKLNLKKKNKIRMRSLIGKKKKNNNKSIWKKKILFIFLSKYLKKKSPFRFFFNTIHWKKNDLKFLKSKIKKRYVPILKKKYRYKKDKDKIKQIIDYLYRKKKFKIINKYENILYYFKEKEFLVFDKYEEICWEYLKNLKKDGMFFEHYLFLLDIYDLFFIEVEKIKNKGLLYYWFNRNLDQKLIKRKQNLLNRHNNDNNFFLPDEDYIQLQTDIIEYYKIWNKVGPIMRFFIGFVYMVTELEKFFYSLIRYNKFKYELKKKYNKLYNEKFVKENIKLKKFLNIKKLNIKNLLKKEYKILKILRKDVKKKRKDILLSRKKHNLVSFLFTKKFKKLWKKKKNSLEKRNLVLKRLYIKDNIGLNKEKQVHWKEKIKNQKFLIKKTKQDLNKNNRIKFLKESIKIKKIYINILQNRIKLSNKEIKAFLDKLNEINTFLNLIDEKKNIKYNLDYLKKISKLYLKNKKELKKETEDELEKKILEYRNKILKNKDIMNGHNIIFLYNNIDEETHLLLKELKRKKSATYKELNFMKKKKKRLKTLVNQWLKKKLNDSDLQHFFTLNKDIFSGKFYFGRKFNERFKKSLYNSNALIKKLILISSLEKKEIKSIKRRIKNLKKNIVKLESIVYNLKKKKNKKILKKYKKLLKKENNKLKNLNIKIINKYYERYHIKELKEDIKITVKKGVGFFKRQKCKKKKKKDKLKIYYNFLKKGSNIKKLKQIKFRPDIQKNFNILIKNRKKNLNQLKKIIKQKKIQKYLGKFTKYRYGFDILKHLNWKYYEKGYTHAMTKRRIHNELYTLNYIRFSYTRLFFMLWLMHTYTENVTKPENLMQNKYYNRKNLFQIVCGMYFTYLKKPFFDILGFFISKAIFRWLGLKINFNYYIVTNNEVPAQFIARHIALAFKLGYRWREVVKPIRKDLNFLLSSLRFVYNGKFNTNYDEYKNWLLDSSNNLYKFSNVYIKLYFNRFIKNIYISLKKQFLNIYFFLKKQQKILKFEKNLKYKFYLNSEEKIFDKKRFNYITPIKGTNVRDFFFLWSNFNRFIRKYINCLFFFYNKILNYYPWFYSRYSNYIFNFLKLFNSNLFFKKLKNKKIKHKFIKNYIKSFNKKKQVFFLLNWLSEKKNRKFVLKKKYRDIKKKYYNDFYFFFLSKFLKKNRKYLLKKKDNIKEEFFFIGEDYKLALIDNFFIFGSGLYKRQINRILKRLRKKYNKKDIKIQELLFYLKKNGLSVYEKDNITLKKKIDILRNFNFDFLNNKNLPKDLKIFFYKKRLIFLKKLKEVQKRINKKMRIFNFLMKFLKKNIKIFKKLVFYKRKLKKKYIYKNQDNVNYLKKKDFIGLMEKRKSVELLNFKDNLFLRKVNKFRFFNKKFFKIFFCGKKKNHKNIYFLKLLNRKKNIFNKKGLNYKIKNNVINYNLFFLLKFFEKNKKYFLKDINFRNLYQHLLGKFFKNKEIFQYFLNNYLKKNIMQFFFFNLIELKIFYKKLSIYLNFNFLFFFDKEIRRIKKEINILNKLKKNILYYLKKKEINKNLEILKLIYDNWENYLKKNIIKDYLNIFLFFDWKFKYNIMLYKKIYNNFLFNDLKQNYYKFSKNIINVKELVTIKSNVDLKLENKKLSKNVFWNRNNVQKCLQKFKLIFLLKKLKLIKNKKKISSKKINWKKKYENWKKTFWIIFIKKLKISDLEIKKIFIDFLRKNIILKKKNKSYFLKKLYIRKYFRKIRILILKLKKKYNINSKTFLEKFYLYFWKKNYEKNIKKTKMVNYNHTLWDLRPYVVFLSHERDFTKVTGKVWETPKFIDIVRTVYGLFIFDFLRWYLDTKLENIKTEAVWNYFKLFINYWKEHMQNKVNFLKTYKAFSFFFNRSVVYKCIFDIENGSILHNVQLRLQNYLSKCFKKESDIAIRFSIGVHLIRFWQTGLLYLWRQDCVYLGLNRLKYSENKKYINNKLLKKNKIEYYRKNALIEELYYYWKEIENYKILEKKEKICSKFISVLYKKLLKNILEKNKKIKNKQIFKNFYNKKIYRLWNKKKNKIINKVFLKLNWKNKVYLTLIEKNIFKKDNLMKTFFFFKNINKKKLNDYIINLKKMVSLKKFDWNLVESIKQKKIRWSKYSKILKKKTFIDYFYKNRMILGYKLRFAGRFKRRRIRSLIYVRKGLLPVSSHSKWVDYGNYVTAKEYSAYSIRVWINRNTNFIYRHFYKL